MLAPVERKCADESFCRRPPIGSRAMTRTSSMKAVALVVALASLTINFGLIDLIDGYTGFVDQARNQVLDAGWGLVFGVVLPIGLLAQLRRPERRIAGIQQTGICCARARCCGRHRRGVVVPGVGGGNRGCVRRVAGAASGTTDVPQAWATPGAGDAGPRGPCSRSEPCVRGTDGLGPAARSSARGCRVERPPPLDRDDGARTARPPSRPARRAPHRRVANPRVQRFDCGRRLGDLMPARTGVGGGKRGPWVGVGGTGLGCRASSRRLCGLRGVSVRSSNRRWR